MAKQRAPNFTLQENTLLAYLSDLMARQRPTRLIMGPCIVEIDRIYIVIREVQYQLEVNRCRNEEIIVKGYFGWAWPMWAGRPRVGNGAMHKVQYQFEVNRCRNKEIIVKGNFGSAWPMWAGCPRIYRIVIREVQYQFEVNRCRNEEIIVKGNFGWACPMWPERPRLVMGPCIVEIDRIVIREAQYQFEVNRCRNEDVNFQGSSANSVGGAGGQDGRTDGRTSPQYPHFFSEKTGAPWLVMGPCIVEIDRIVIREVQYQLEVNRCKNEEIIVKGNFGWA
ncbi:hypothetical protein DPMN_146015 [Dreissena polymorpha]|uniref:Uncharacterized protein n=1 Tax=Dreissena polymorpha TaxID=45954 RepID=A0A9D4F5X1_DREPO|nr:hypothetical protein DPMN_146015 [Dreissena polymorpha]